MYYRDRLTDVILWIMIIFINGCNIRLMGWVLVIKSFFVLFRKKVSHNMRKHTFWPVHPLKTQISLCIHIVNLIGVFIVRMKKLCTLGFLCKLFSFLHRWNEITYHLKFTVLHYTPAIFIWGHIVSPLSVCPSGRPMCMKNGFRPISFEKISVLDSYFIHRLIKYRSSSIEGKNHYLLWN